LVLGGSYLAYEGTESLGEKLGLIKEHGYSNEHSIPNTDDLTAAEDKTVASAVRTDTILSIEIIALTIASVTTETITTQIGVLILIGLIATVGVYGVVGLIIKMDDVGFHLRDAHAKNQGYQLISKLLILGMPKVMKALGVIGMIAMLMVGGGILIHNLPFLYDVNHLGASLPFILPMAIEYFISPVTVALIVGVMIVILQKVSLGLLMKSVILISGSALLLLWSGLVTLNLSEKVVDYEFWFVLVTLAWALVEFYELYKKYIWNRYLVTRSLAYGYVNNFISKVIQSQLSDYSVDRLHPGDFFVIPNNSENIEEIRESGCEHIEIDNGYIRAISIVKNDKDKKLYDYPKTLTQYLTSDCFKGEDERLSHEKGLFFSFVRRELEERGLIDFVQLPKKSEYIEKFKLKYFFYDIKNTCNATRNPSKHIETLWLSVLLLLCLSVLFYVAFSWWKGVDVPTPWLSLNAEAALTIIIILTTVLAERLVSSVVEYKRYSAIESLAQGYYVNFIDGEFMKNIKEKFKKVTLEIYFPKNIKELSDNHNASLDLKAKIKGYNLKKITIDEKPISQGKEFWKLDGEEISILDFPSTLTSIEPLLVQSPYDTDIEDKGRTEKYIKEFLKKIKNLASDNDINITESRK
jgi:predicted DNA repair protein MutK